MNKYLFALILTCSSMAFSTESRMPYPCEAYPHILAYLQEQIRNAQTPEERKMFEERAQNELLRATKEGCFPDFQEAKIAFKLAEAAVNQPSAFQQQ